MGEFTLFVLPLGYDDKHDSFRTRETLGVGDGQRHATLYNMVDFFTFWNHVFYVAHVGMVYKWTELIFTVD